MTKNSYVSNAHREFIAMRDELQARHADLDLAGVWDGMKRSERKAVLLSATIIEHNDSNKRRAEVLSTPLLRMSKDDRIAIRNAIYRMSAFASGLKDRCHKRSAPGHVELAQQARAALEKGDMTAARHFISLIETAS